MATHLDSLRLQARTLPEDPGVYFWKDGRDQILYIGKAVNLRSRVTSYFSTARRDRRVREMLSRARSIKYEVTSTELQALFRESALIKQEQPQYNWALKRSRPDYFMKFDASLDDPYLEMSRGKEDDASLYFGPFRSAAVVRETMNFVHDVLPLRKCTAIKPRCKPCLYYQMHTCAAPLLDEQHRRQHQEAILQLYDLLDGRGDRVATWLEAKRNKLSEALLFERAADIHARLVALRALLKRQVILEAAVQCRCVLIRQELEGDDARLLLVAHGNVLSVRNAQSAIPAEISSWIRAHEPLLKQARLQQTRVDSASVLERWLNVQRERVRWVAIPHDLTDADLLDRLAYVLDPITVSDD